MKIFLLFTFAFLLVTGIRAQEIGTVTDWEDNRVYKTIKIGNQWWMAENLSYLPSKGAFCYDDDESNCEKFGRLYTWEVAKRACPRGWRLPSKEEFQFLLDFVEDETGQAYKQLIFEGNSGFNASLGGLRKKTYYENINVNAYFWTNSEDFLNNIWYLNMLSENENVFFYFSKDDLALSVRCLKN